MYSTNTAVLSAIWIILGVAAFCVIKTSDFEASEDERLDAELTSQISSDTEESEAGLLLSLGKLAKRPELYMLAAYGCGVDPTLEVSTVTSEKAR